MKSDSHNTTGVSLLLQFSINTNKMNLTEVFFFAHVFLLLLLLRFVCLFCVHGCFFFFLLFFALKILILYKRKKNRQLTKHRFSSNIYLNKQMIIDDVFHHWWPGRKTSIDLLNGNSFRFVSSIWHPTVNFHHRFLIKSEGIVLKSLLLTCSWQQSVLLTRSFPFFSFSIICSKKNTSSSVSSSRRIDKRTWPSCRFAYKDKIIFQTFRVSRKNRFDFELKFFTKNNEFCHITDKRKRKTSIAPKNYLAMFFARRDILSFGMPNDWRHHRP